MTSAPNLCFRLTTNSPLLHGTVQNIPVIRFLPDCIVISSAIHLSVATEVLVGAPRIRGLGRFVLPASVLAAETKPTDSREAD
jgi:hypothetical protein